MKRFTGKSYICYALSLLACAVLVFLLYSYVSVQSALVSALIAGAVLVAAWAIPVALGRGGAGRDRITRTHMRLMERPDAPIGGYAVFPEENCVVLTQSVRELLGLHSPTLPLDEWEALVRSLTAEQADGYPDVYRFTPPGGGADRWLRISRFDNGEGRTGTVVDVTADVEQSRKLAHDLDYDPLTGLYSRAAFKREVHSKITAKPDAVGAMIFADLDNLKEINDTYGHNVGDQHLILAAKTLSRFSDYGGAVSRISGDEFAIYLHGYESREELLEIIQNQFTTFRETLIRTTAGQVPVLRCSAGVAIYPRDADNSTDLLKLADFAMYEAKRNCKGALLEFNRESYEECNYFLDQVW